MPARPACLARHAPSPHTPLARKFYVLTQRVLSRSSCAHYCTGPSRKYSRTRCLRQRSRSTHPIDRGRGRRRAPGWPGWPRARARSGSHGGAAAAAAAAPRGGRWWRLGVREPVLRGGSVASVARANRVEQEAPRGDDLVESGGLVRVVPVHRRFVRSGENRHVRVS